MEAKVCPNNHYYDSEKYATCPFCNSSNNGDAGETMPIGGTMPLHTADFSPIPPTEPITSGASGNGYQDLGKTLPLSSASMPASSEDYGATMPHDEAVLGFTPTVGWIVCISGPHKGQDFRLITGYNKVGRAPEMAIALTKDEQVTRDSHAIVAYEPQARKFFVFGDGNMIYLNGNFVVGVQELHINDVIKLGASEMMFIPLCSEAFSWE